MNMKKISQSWFLRELKFPWVDGVLEYIKNNFENQSFYIVTATPQNEIEMILDKLEIAKYFKDVVDRNKQRCS